MEKFRNVNEMFQASVKKYGNRMALRQRKPEGWVACSWHDWLTASQETALGLYDLGVKPKDMAAIICSNRLEWVFVDQGVLSLGAVLVPIYVTNPAKEVAYIMSNSEAKIIVVENRGQLEKILATRDQLPHLKKVVIIDPEGELDPNFVITLSDLRALGRARGQKEPGLFDQLWQTPVRDDVATLVYTSGTTGPPKGAMISHGNILWVCESMKDIVPAGDTDTTLSFLPLCHVFERMGGEFPSILNGVTVNFAQGMDTLARDISEAQPTILLAVPRVCEKIYATIRSKVQNNPKPVQALFLWSLGVGRKVTPYKLKHTQPPFLLNLQYLVASKLVFGKLREAVGGRLRFMVAAGAPLAPEVAQFFHAADIFVVEGYGMTETSAPSSVNTLHHCKLGTVGKLLPGMEVKFDSDGEILFKGGNIFKGYWKMPEATRDAFTEDGWLRTGDIGELDNEGYLKITDRKKDLIITAGGKNVAPQNIENMLVGDQYIAQAMVYGDRRKYLTALITLDEEQVSRWAKDQGIAFSQVSELAANPKVIELIKSRIAIYNKELARYETIKDIRILDHNFTEESGDLTPTLKVKRKLVTKKYQQLLDSMYSKEDIVS